MSENSSGRDNYAQTEPHYTRQDLSRILEDIVAKTHEAIDVAKALDERDECPVDTYLLEDLQTSAENLCNTSEGFDENDGEIDGESDGK